MILFKTRMITNIKSPLKKQKVYEGNPKSLNDGGSARKNQQKRMEEEKRKSLYMTNQMNTIYV